MIMNLPAPLLNTKQIAKTVDITAEKLNKKIAAHFGAPMNAHTLAAVKKFLFDFFSDLRPYLPITQGDLDNRAKIFWYAICDFNNSLKVIFATDAKKPADSAGVSNLIQIFI